MLNSPENGRKSFDSTILRQETESIIENGIFGTGIRSLEMAFSRYFIIFRNF